MKIAFIGGRDIHLLGGIENYMLNLATQLVKMGHEPIVFCESDHNGEEWINGFRVIHQKGPKSPYLCKIWLGLKSTLVLVRRFKSFNIIHYNAWPPSLSSPIARLFGIKTIMQGHGLEWQRSKYSHFQQKLLLFMERFATFINSNMIMCSEDQTRYFKKKYNKEAPTIPTAINLPATDKKDTDILNRFNLTKEKYFLFLARLVQDKNPDYLIKGFIKANIPGYKLVIAGNNPSNQQYVEYLHQLGKNNPDIVFTDAVYGDDKETLLRNAFAFCVPSTIEGLSISLLEGMSYNLPIIASTIPANREVLEDDKAYWCKAEDVSSLSEALLSAITDNQRTAKTDYNYKKITNNYTWEKVAERYIKYLKSKI